jgi:magnesium-transporting ATPase (P-type)
LAEKLGKFAGTTFDYKKSPTGYSDLLEKTIKRVATLDFSSQRKTMSTIVTGYPGASGNAILLKGAPERVLERCNGVTLSDGSTYKFKLESEKTEMIANI